jgi:hypothetical protein
MKNPAAQEKSGQANTEPEQVTLGTHVEVELVPATGAGEALEFDVVPDNRADFAAGFMGVGTPLVQAILGHRAGSRIEYKLADVVEVRIISISASEKAPAHDVGAQRQAVIREAIGRSTLADAQRLAITVDVKWGDYDPEGIEANWADRGGGADE